MNRVEPSAGWAVLWAFLIALRFVATPAQTLETLDERRLHLRSGEAAEWEQFSGSTPHGRRFEVRFNMADPPPEGALLIHQDDVKLEWGLELNGKRIGKLFQMEAPLIWTLPVSSADLRPGENLLSIIPPAQNDDIFAGPIRFLAGNLSQPESLPQCVIEVKEAPGGGAIPARLTLVNAAGELAPVLAESGQDLAVRPGVAYTPNGLARLRLLPGEYTIHASRGFEYGVASRAVTLKPGSRERLILEIRREVPTSGWVSSDTHTHTFTFSRHGDAAIEDRVVTLAGEGIELPIATDHEHLTDYSAAAAKLGLDRYFTPVVGCETTTAKGHFNSFPIELGSRVPDLRIVHWPSLMDHIRQTPGVRVVILNHPRNVHQNFQPFAAAHFNAVTGENLRGFEFGFDAMEIVNSSALQSDIMLAFHDWFALLNYGYRVTGVGSSDVHDVSRYIVGQGRSYVRCDDADPSRINVAQACQSFLEGRVLISMGLLAQMTVQDRFEVGDLARLTTEEMKVSLRVSGPSWVEARRVILFSNGIPIREQILEKTRASINGSSSPKTPLTMQVHWRVPRPAHDVHLVALALGPGVKEPFWAIPRPYQASSPVWNPQVIGATNPIWIDADGDGKFTPARAYAERLLKESGSEPSRLLDALGSYDESIAAQTARLCHGQGWDLQSEEFTAALKRSAQATRDGFKRYGETLK